MKVVSNKAIHLTGLRGTEVLKYDLLHRGNYFAPNPARAEVDIEENYAPMFSAADIRRILQEAKNLLPGDRLRLGIADPGPAADGAGAGGGDGGGGEGGGGDGGGEGKGKDKKGGKSGKPVYTKEELKKIRDEVKEAMVSAAQSTGAGNLPGALQRLVADLTEPKMDWRELLNMSIQSTVKTDYSFLNRSKKGYFSDIALPGMIPENTIDIALSLDMSGSISDAQGRDMLSEVKGIMEQFKDFKLKVWCFDTKVYNYQEFTPQNIDEFDTYELKGGGGTNFDVNWDFMKENDINISGQNIIENSEKLLYDLAEKGTFNSSLIKFDDAMKQTIEMASAAYKNEEGIVGVPTGLRDLDDKLGGLHQSDLIIIAGRPSMGKTSLATNIAFNAAKNLQDSGKESTIAFFSLEMSSEQLSTRIISEQARISSNDIRRGRISDDQFDKFLETSKNISELPLYIDETPAISIAALSNRARRIKRLFGLDMIVVDYIQLMRGITFNKDGRVQEISQITQGLKAIAKELSVPVVALSQLSRQVEQRDDHKPQLADLRESGSIEQDADVVMFVYREGYYLSRKEPREATVEHAEWQAKMNEVAHLAQIIIGKQRHGPIGNVTLEFEERFTKFKDTQLS